MSTAGLEIYDSGGNIEINNSSNTFKVLCIDSYKSDGHYSGLYNTFNHKTYTNDLFSKGKGFVYLIYFSCPDSLSADQPSFSNTIVYTISGNTLTLYFLRPSSTYKYLVGVA